MNNIIEINKRYSELAQDDECCLSCGGAIDYSKAQMGEICVDIGSGRGTDALRLAEMVGNKGFVYGIDIADGMIEKATKNAEKLGVSNVKFIKSELENINLPSDIADLIISNCTINHASNKQAVWNELYRIMKNKGRFVISDIYSSIDVPSEYKNDPIAISECWGGAITKEKYLKIIAEAGFTDIEILEESKPYSKGKIEVSSFTFMGFKKKKCGCNSN